MKIKLILPKAVSQDGTLSDFTFMLKLLTPKTSGGGKNIMAFMPLALPTLAALTPRNIDVCIVDENVEPIDFEEAVDVVGISFVSFMAPRAYQIADAYRARGIYVVLGGIHATMCPEEAAAHADTIFIGEAESTWPQFVTDFVEKQAKPMYRCETKPDLQNLILPRWDLVKNKYYLTQLVQTTRGCSYNCDFCMIRSLYGAPRSKPVQYVISEIMQVGKIKRMPGPLKIMFADDNIVANVNYAKRLFKAMVPLKLRWTSQASINIAQDDQLLDLAQQSGCDTLLIGFESISQSSLNAVNKGQINKVETFRKSIEKLHSRGINIYSYIIFGFDQEDGSTFRQTLDFIREMSIEFPLFNLLSPSPGTRLYERLLAEDRILPNQGWGDMNGYKVCFKPKQMSGEELLRGFHWSIANAYSYEAIIDRMEKGYANGALKTKDKNLISRIGLTVLLLKELKGQTPKMRLFIKRVIKELWQKSDIKVNALLMFLDRFQFAEQFTKKHPELTAMGPLTEKSAEQS